MQSGVNELLEKLDRSPTALEAAADDWGHTVHHKPQGVFTPSTVGELAALVSEANAHELTVAARGRGHSTLGQAQAADGIVVDMRSLNRIGEIENESVWVEAGATWREVLAHCLSQGLTPPIFTDYIDLTIGGTISVGGIGAQTYSSGLQTDNVLALEVITAVGEIVTCSLTENSDLFDLARAGLGQFGIISKARLSLQPSKAMVRYVRTLHADLGSFLDELFSLAAEGRYEGLEGFAVPNDPAGLAQATGNAFPNVQMPVGDNMWLFMIEGAKYYDVGNEPDDASLVEGLSIIPGAINSMDLPYVAYIARLDLVEAALREAGIWDFPHPWIDVFVPRASAAQFIQDELAQLTSDEVGGPMLVYPYRRSAISTPNFPLPKSEEIVLFALLRTALPPTPERVSQLWDANYQIYARCLAAGGTGYSIDAIPLEQGQWKDHFGERWPALVDAKQHYDPGHILAPGQNIFNNSEK